MKHFTLPKPEKCWRAPIRIVWPAVILTFTIAITTFFILHVNGIDYGTAPMAILSMIPTLPLFIYMMFASKKIDDYCDWEEELVKYINDSIVFDHICETIKPITEEQYFEIKAMLLKDFSPQTEQGLLDCYERIKKLQPQEEDKEDDEEDDHRYE